MAPDVKAALFQLQPRLGEPARNLATLEKRVASAKADLCVFPELFLTGYFNRDLLRTLAEPLDGALGKGLLRAAKRTGAHIVAGMPREGAQRGVVHNSSVLASPDGELHAYDKVYLPTFSVFEEDVYFGEGHALPVAKTSLGRVGMCICYDLFFPEVTKGMALQGADLLTCISASPTISRRYFEAVLPARAIETTCFLLFTNLVGPQDQVHFWGGAKAYGPRGDLQAEGPLLKEAATRATLDMEEVRVARAKRPVLRDTRPEWGRGAWADALPAELRLVEALHGALEPWAVAGLRLGMAGRRALRTPEGARAPDLEVEAACPLKPPRAALLDGLQAGSGCTLGNGRLRVREAEEVVVRFRAGGQGATLRLPPAALRLLAGAGGADRGLALELRALPEDEVVERA